MAGTPHSSVAKPDRPVEVAEVLAITFEREIPGGAPWCLPRDAAIVRRWVVDQGRGLGGALRRLVRLVHVVAHAEERGVTHFVYLHLRALRAGEFQAALEVSCKTRRIDRTVFELTGKGLVLSPASGSFEIDYLQMPRLGALLDILHNALGYAVVADLLAPVTAPGRAPVAFEAAARGLEQAFAAWLKARLDTRHHLRQAQIMRSFLAARGKVEADAVTDEAIFLFWQINATSRGPGAVDGFRLFANAARAMLRYRQALADALSEARLKLPANLGDRDWEYAREAADEGELDWVSPLAALLCPPADRIKWLTGKECRTLSNYLGTPRAAVESNDEDGDPGPWIAGLAGDRPFDLRFCRTLLRADVFATAQASIVARRKKRHADSVAHVLSGISQDAFGDVRAVYAEIGEQLRLEGLAALHMLAASGAPEAMILVDALGGPEAAAAVRAIAKPMPAKAADVETLASALAKAVSSAALDPELLQGAGRDLFEGARAAMRKVHRAGFGLPASPETMPALKVAAVVLPDLLGEIDRLLRALAGRSWGPEGRADTKAFASVFAEMYGEDGVLAD